MEVLSGRGHVGHLDVVFGAQQQEAFESGRGVLRALTLVSVGKEHDQPGRLVPLVLGCNQVLIDDDLGPVDEVAELSLPHHHNFGPSQAVAVLEPETGVFRQCGVVDPEVRSRARDHR